MKELLVNEQWEKDYAMFTNSQHVIFGNKLCGCDSHEGYRVLEVSKFYTKEGSSSGLQSWCIECDKNHGKDHLKGTTTLPSRYKGKSMNFNFETPKRGKGRCADKYFIKLTSSKNGTNKDGSLRRSFDIYFSNEAKDILNILGERVVIAFDIKNKQIALKNSSDGWKIANAGGGAKSPKKQIKIQREDMWSNIKDIFLTMESISILDGVVVLNVGNMK